LTSSIENSSDALVPDLSSMGPLSEDEKEAFLKRENELEDLLSEKEAEVEKLKLAIKDLTAEIESLKARDVTLNKVRYLSNLLLSFFPPFPLYFYF